MDLLYIKPAVNIIWMKSVSPLYLLIPEHQYDQYKQYEFSISEF
jgi:hypothetical protein